MTDERDRLTSGRRCVYSVLMGGYEEFQEQPVAAASQTDFILFTDDRELRSDTWQVRYQEPVLPLDPARSSRYAKLLPHRVLPEYDISLYIDNRVLLRQPPETIFDDLLPAGSTFVLNAHDRRATVRDEFDAVVRGKRDAAWVCAEQLEHYESWHPEVLEQRPLWSAFMIRRHHDALLVRAMEIWWTQLLRYSRRDQLSLMLALQEAGLEPTVLFLDAAASPYHEWPSEQRIGRVHGRAGTPATPAGLDDCVEALGQARAQLASADRQVAALQANVRDLRSHAANLRHGRDELLHSTSWRITAPLRRLGDRVKRR